MPTAKATTRKTVKPAPKKPLKTITAEEVWAGFDELRKLHAETEKALKESQKRLEESHARTEETLNRSIASTEETLNKAIASTERTFNKAIGGLSNTMGSLVEQFMTAGLPKKFRKFGFTFNQITTVKWADGENNIYTEIDGLLENGSQAMVVEVKTTLRNEDIDDHLKRMEKVRAYADIKGDRREFLGAIAAVNVDKSSREYALKKGFFVIEPSGEDVKISKPVSEKVW
jgi:hypothetical protein